MNNEQQQLDRLCEQGNLRQLRTTQSRGASIVHQGHQYINLSSNDYLGISSMRSLQQDFFESRDYADFLMSNPSSRLLTGNSPEYEELEALLATIYQSQAALVVGSGFLLNSGLLPAITTASDLIISDKLMHASLIDGIRLSPAAHERYRHNDMNHLETLLQKADGRRVIVATESLFSMDGDRAPLAEIANLQARYDFELYLDEAHAMGVWGDNGRGFAVDIPRLRVDYRVATLGKAICSQGAFVVCTSARRELLVNRMRTLIYSTALPPISLQWSQYIIERLAEFAPQREHLRSLVAMMGGESQIVPWFANNHQMTKPSHLPLVSTNSTPRVAEIEVDSNTLNAKAAELRAKGYWVSAIRPPTVPQGTDRLRFSLTADHTHEQISNLCSLLR